MVVRRIKQEKALGENADELQRVTVHPGDAAGMERPGRLHTPKAEVLQASPG